MDIKIFEDRLDKLFSDAIGVDDTIWYSETETLRDAICDLVIKIPEVVAAEHNRWLCNIRHRRSYTKSITMRLSIEVGRQVSTRLRIAYDPKMDSVSVNPSLRYCGADIFPGTENV